MQPPITMEGYILHGFSRLLCPASNLENTSCIIYTFDIDVNILQLPHRQALVRDHGILGRCMTPVGTTTSLFAGGPYSETFCVNAVASTIGVMTSLRQIRTEGGSGENAI